jgi:hypothetical protein
VKGKPEQKKDYIKINVRRMHLAAQAEGLSLCSSGRFQSFNIANIKAAIRHHPKPTPFITHLKKNLPKI